MDNKNEIEFFIFTLKDVTREILVKNELIKAKEIAEKSEKDLKKAQKTAKVGSWVWYIQENRIIWSDEMYEIFDIDKNDFTGELNKVVENAIHPEDKPAVEQSNISVIKYNKPIPVEYRIIRKDGTVKYVLGLADEMVLDENGKSKILTGVVKDITEYKEIQFELNKAKVRAEESDKLKTSFLNNMSHEIRTPLNAIVGFSQIMTYPNQTLEKLERFSKIIEKSCNKLIEIITDVIEISEIHAKQTILKMNYVDVVPVLKFISSKFQVRAHEKNIEFTLNFSELNQKCYILADEEKFVKAISHLIDNAIKFTQAGSIELNCKLIENNLLMTISDTGIGISSDMHHLVFEPFRQIEIGSTRNYGGNGIGLSIVKAYIELFNGRIEFKSELKVGTVVNVYIPLSQNQIQPTVKECNKFKTLIKKVLIVEDEYTNFQYLSELLQDYNFEILYADNGQTALDLINENTSVDLIFMDIKMPVLDGYTATLKIKELKPDLPVIAQTAYALENEKEKYGDIFDDYLAKPILPEKLKTLLMKYMIVED